MKIIDNSPSELINLCVMALLVAGMLMFIDIIARKRGEDGDQRKDTRNTGNTD